MKTYNQKQKSNIHAKGYAAMISGIATVCNAYLKENALSYFQKLDSSLTIEDVYYYNSPGAYLVDEFVLQYDFKEDKDFYTIQLKNED
jgi:hypothetical protein